jgi:hypothetical protein
MRVKARLILLSEPVWMMRCREIRSCDEHTEEIERNTIVHRFAERKMTRGIWR